MAAHIVFDRPTGEEKCFAPDGSVWRVLEAGGDAWGNIPGNDGIPPYGVNCWMPPGHYVLGTPQWFETPIPSEGFGQIQVLDIDADLLNTLVAAGKAGLINGQVSIAGIVAPVGQLLQYDRDGIMHHSGGSNLGVPECYADDQPLCKTEGCTREHNADWKELADWVRSQQDAGNHVIYTAIGDPIILSC
jgi:hypothetical protein